VFVEHHGNRARTGVASGVLPKGRGASVKERSPPCSPGRGRLESPRFEDGKFGPRTKVFTSPEEMNRCAFEPSAGRSLGVDVLEFGGSCRWATQPLLSPTRG